MSLDSLAGMFSQRTGAQQSMSGSIMNAIIGYIMQNMMQKGLSSFLGGGGGGGSDAGGLKSALSSLGGGLNRDHALVRHVQQNTGIQDPDQATQYTQHGVNLLNEQANSNPQGLQSLLGNFLGSSGGGSKQQQGKGGLLGDILGG
jgi:hypothetical protein